ncbi:hypothetical protein [Saccharothrix xinjiangensis]|uniref:Uncharacterized protein n=1 Tax=Saccharothrix xinjiangensis TaxID=204798 RepID=A0ABV9Y323_9PSEU
MYLYLHRTDVLDLDDGVPNLGFELLTDEVDDPPDLLPQRLDELLVAGRRHARILAGHGLAADLERLAGFAVRRRLPGVESVARSWMTRGTAGKGPGAAVVFDTALDEPAGPEPDLMALCDRAGLKATTVAVPAVDPPTAPAVSALVRTTAVALLAARALGRYWWSRPIDLDTLVLDSAWDHLEALSGGDTRLTGR